MKSCLSIFCLFVYLLCTAQKEQQLVVGDDAPPITFTKWMKGDSIAELNKGKIYVIDLWATWCVPCIAGMPRLTEIQKKYKNDIYVLGITSVDSFGNTFENAQAFLNEKTDITSYHFAWVPESSSSGKDRYGKQLRGIFLHPWMRLIGSYSLPTAFIINKEGKIAFIGDPAMIEKTLDEMVQGKFDLATAKNNYLQTAKAGIDIDSMKATIKRKDIDKAISYGDKLLNGYTYYNPKTFLSLSTAISTNEEINNARLNQIALRAARKAVQLTHFESSGYFDALATAYYRIGDYFNAALSEQSAIGLSEGTMKENQKKNLDKYLNLLSTHDD
jgi:thiol-disulfide isomerase/thioredoxin